MLDEAGVVLAGALLKRTLMDLTDPRQWPGAWHFAHAAGADLIEHLGGDVVMWLQVVQEVGGHMQGNEPLDKLLDGLKRGMGQCVKAIETYQEEQRREAAKAQKETQRA